MSSLESNHSSFGKTISFLRVYVNWWFPPPRPVTPLVRSGGGKSLKEVKYSIPILELYVALAWFSVLVLFLFFSPQISSAFQAMVEKSCVRKVKWNTEGFKNFFRFQAVGERSNENPKEWISIAYIRMWVCEEVLDSFLRKGSNVERRESQFHSHRHSLFFPLSSCVIWCETCIPFKQSLRILSLWV